MFKTIERFAAHYGIPRAKIIDARNAKRCVWESEMQKGNAEYAYNVKPCKDASVHLTVHRVGKFRGCVQCYPQTIEHAKKHKAGGFVYLAVSSASQAANKALIKIGISDNTEARAAELNKGYGGIFDWKIYAKRHVASHMGQIEQRIHSKLRAYACIGGMYRNDQEAREMFAVHLETALEVFDAEVAR